MNALLVALALAAGGLELSADSLVLTPGSRVAVATGRVVARSDSFEVRCEQAEVSYVESGGRRVVDGLVLTRSVHALRHSDGATSSSTQATWKRADGKLVLTGEPEVHRGPDVVLGERIEFGTLDDSIFVQQPAVTLAGARATPVHVTARRLSSLPGGRDLRFEEKVTVREGELVATSSRADVRLEGDGEAREVSAVTLTGRVVAVRGEQTGRAKKAVWNARTGDLVMEGNPIVEQKGESISGKRITLEGATGRARVETAIVKIQRKQ